MFSARCVSKVYVSGARGPHALSRRLRQRDMHLHRAAMSCDTTADERARILCRCGTQGCRYRTCQQHMTPKHSAASGCRSGPCTCMRTARRAMRWTGLAWQRAGLPLGTVGEAYMCGSLAARGPGLSAGHMRYGAYAS